MPGVDSIQIGQQNFDSKVIFHDEFEDVRTMSKKYIDYNSSSGACDICIHLKVNIIMLRQ